MARRSAPPFSVVSGLAWLGMVYGLIRGCVAKGANQRVWVDHSVSGVAYVAVHPHKKEGCILVGTPILPLAGPLGRWV